MCQNGFSTATSSVKCGWPWKKDATSGRKRVFLSARYLGVSGFGGEKSVPEDTALTGLAEAAPWEREAYGAEGMESLR